MAKIRAEYAEIRERHKVAARPSAWFRLNTRADRHFAGDWEDVSPPSPKQTGVTVLDDYPLATIAERIDWTPFFKTWELSGHYPQILDDAIVGTQARELFRDAQAMLEKIISENGCAHAPCSAMAGQSQSATMSRCSRMTIGPGQSSHRLRCISSVSRSTSRLAVRLLPGRLHRTDRSRRSGLYRRIRGHRRRRHRAAPRAFRSRPRRLLVDPAQGAGRSPGRGVRRAPARARAPRILGLCRR